MSLRTYYERQAATSRRLADQAITREVAQRLLAIANDYDQRAQACDMAMPGERRPFEAPAPRA
jgi:hypothetical protein